MTVRRENHVFLWEEGEVMPVTLHRHLIGQKLKPKGKIAVNRRVFKNMQVCVDGEILCNFRKNTGMYR